MSKILGLDLGTNSIGWAIVDDSADKIVDCGVRIFPTSTNHERLLARQKRRTENRFVQRKLSFYEKSQLSKLTNPIILTLVFCLFLTVLMIILNYSNWQFWLNISLTILITMLSLLHSNNKK